MLFLAGLDCGFKSDIPFEEQNVEMLVPQCLDIYSELLTPAQNIIESLLATNVGPFSLSRINELILNTWRFQLKSAETCFIDGMTYGTKIKPR
jgi:hypothetical protein